LARHKGSLQNQTALGATWAIIQPVFTMLVFSLFFGRLGKIPSDGIPYPIFAFAALVPWTFLQNGLGQSFKQFGCNANLITKIYFPRLIVPLASVFSGIVDFLIAFIVLLGIDVLLRSGANAQRALAAAVCLAGFGYFVGCRSLALSPER